jgi:hypothetical protein
MTTRPAKPRKNPPPRRRRLPLLPIQEELSELSQFLYHLRCLPPLQRLPFVLSPQELIELLSLLKLPPGQLPKPYQPETSPLADLLDRLKSPSHRKQPNRSPGSTIN